MNNFNSDSRQLPKEEAFEIVELASSDILTLAKAFDLIAETCREMNAGLVLPLVPEDKLVH